MGLTLRHKNRAGSYNGMTTRISIIVPCYNEEQTIEATVQRLLAVDHGFDSEVIVVDDGSTDRTRDVLKDLNGIVVVHHDHNRGKGASILTGAEKASGEVLVVQDADLEYDPADIPRLVGPILEDRFDAVYGSRFKGKMTGMRMSHYIGNKILTYATCLLYKTRLTDVLTGHKAFKAEVFRSLDLHASRFEFELEATAKVLEHGNTIGEIPITYCVRRLGKAKISWIDGAKCLVYLIRLRHEMWSKRDNSKIRVLEMKASTGESDEFHEQADLPRELSVYANSTGFDPRLHSPSGSVSSPSRFRDT